MTNLLKQWLSVLREARKMRFLHRSGQKSAHQFSRTTFKANDIVKHHSNDVEYMVLWTPADGLTIENGSFPAYAYRCLSKLDAPTWIRPAHEMEDGRFVLVEES